MHRLLTTVLMLAFSATIAVAQTPTKTAAKTPARAATKEPLVEFEMMTWLEVEPRLKPARRPRWFSTGGTEQRGPQNVNGGHN